MSKKIIEFNETMEKNKADYSVDDSEILNLYGHLDFYKKTFNNFQILNKATLSNIHELQAENQLLKKEIKIYNDKNVYLSNIGKTKSYKFAYFIRRFSLQFIKGSRKEKINFFKWVKAKILRKNYEDESKFLNPLLNL